MQNIYIYICIRTNYCTQSLVYSTVQNRPGLLKLNEAVLRQPRLIVEVRMLHRQTALGGAGWMGDEFQPTLAYWC